MKKLISLLVMILLLLTAALAETSTPTCTTVTLATGSVRGGFPREDVRGFPRLHGRKPSGNDGGIPVPGRVSKKRQAVRAFCPDSHFLSVSCFLQFVQQCALALVVPAPLFSKVSNYLSSLVGAFHSFQLLDDLAVGGARRSRLHSAIHHVAIECQRAGGIPCHQRVKIGTQSLKIAVLLNPLEQLLPLLNGCQQG